jgi:16S rRNA C967 or C1407 C5-methylase (RsmB/RsmF family)
MNLPADRNPDNPLAAQVLLDPPCTALGLRPRFKIDDETAHDLQKALPSFQLAFAWAAVYLLKPGMDTRHIISC